MTTNKNYITPEGFKALQDEFKALFNGERPKLVETIAWAAGNGDRSENADYIYGKRRLREIDRRLQFLTKRIEAADVIDPKQVNSKNVVFGATVALENEDGEEVTYKIIGEDELDPKNKKISWKSPIANALLGKSVDDEVKVKLPEGEAFYTILSIEYK